MRIVYFFMDENFHLKKINFCYLISQALVLIGKSSTILQLIHLIKVGFPS